jgi:hypothetical protein
MLHRVAPEDSPGVALTRLEVDLPERLVPDQDEASQRAKTRSAYLIKVARLGGDLARAQDAPPGNLVMWRGLSRLTEIELGFQIGAKLMGN